MLEVSKGLGFLDRLFISVVNRSQFLLILTAIMVRLSGAHVEVVLVDSAFDIRVSIEPGSDLSGRISARHFRDGVDGDEPTVLSLGAAFIVMKEGLDGELDAIVW